MRGMSTPAIRLDRPDDTAPLRPPASGPTSAAPRAAASVRP